MIANQKPSNPGFKKAQAFANCVLVDSEDHAVILPSGKQARFPKGLPIHEDTEIGKNILTWLKTNPGLTLRIEATVQLAERDSAEIEVMACPF